MVTRDDETWECISQKLSEILVKDSCYMASIDLCRSNDYTSPTYKNFDKKEDFTNPVVLRIWLSNSKFKLEQLVYESEIVDYSDWKTNMFQFRPTHNFKYIHLQCFYKTPVLYPYNGHIMLDNMSHLIKKVCE